MRLIDADALKQHYAWWGDCGEKGEENKRIFDEIIDLHPTVGGWISVEDKLPDTEGEYIVKSTAGGRSNGVMAMDYVFTTIRRKPVRRWEWYHRISPWTVTHWQSLPAPPEVE